MLLHRLQSCSPLAHTGKRSVAASLPHGAGRRRLPQGDTVARSCRCRPKTVTCHAYFEEPGPLDPRALEEQQRRDATLAKIDGQLSELDDTNLLQTALAASIVAENYALASRIRDRLEEVTGGKATRIDWSSLQIPDWLSDRLERLGFKFPTEVQRRAAMVLLNGLDVAVQSETGSGKTLSFLVPTLANMRYPPEVFPDDLKGPQAIVVVPTMELGVQVCLLAYRLFGGSVSHGQPGDTANMFTYTGPKNILVRGLLNKEEIVMAQETPYLNGAHLVVTTPKALMQVASGENRKPLLDHLRVLCIDEFDECLSKSPEATMMLLSSAVNHNAAQVKPQVVLVGATLRNDHISLATSARWLSDPVVIKVGEEVGVPSSLRHRFVVCDSSRQLAMLVRMLRQDLADGNQDLARNRTIVFASSAEAAAECVEPLRSALWNEHSISLMLPPGSPPPTPAPGSSAWADKDQVPLSNPPNPEDTDKASHELAGSSPFSAIDPIRALLSFRDHKTSLLLCTPQAARGLDLPSVQHVYNLGCPSDHTQYLHRAGRAGRIGSTQGGTITTIITPDEIPALTAIMGRLSLSGMQQEDSETGVPLLELTGADLTELPEGEAGSGDQVEKIRKGLEDIFNLL